MCENGCFFIPIAENENKNKKISKKVLTWGVEVCYNTKAHPEMGRATGAKRSRKTFLKKMKKVLDKGKRRWYNIQAVREGGEMLLEN